LPYKKEKQSKAKQILYGVEGCGRRKEGAEIEGRGILIL